MENAEFDRLLARYKLFFQWNEASKMWRLSSHKRAGSDIATHPGRPAGSIEEARAAALRVLLTMSQTVYTHPRETTELDTLLTKYRLTFNWGDPGLRWWLVGQNKGSNALCKTDPRPAANIEIAKAEAVQYILDKYQSPPSEIES